MIFETDRLLIRKAGTGDAGLYHSLWTNPDVMGNVGFPRGLEITLEEIKDKLGNQPESPFDRLLVVLLKKTGEPIGECSLHPPDESGTARTDVKLLPAHWGNGYGVETKRGLLKYLFENTGCAAVEASPNVKNHASIRMQEAVGGIRTGESVYRFPEEMRSYTSPVHHYIYRVSRETWERLSRSQAYQEHTASDSQDPGENRQEFAGSES